MKNKIALLCLGLASASFALDEYLPVAPSKLEVDVGVSRAAPEVGNVTTSVPLQFKYGIMEGLDAELGLAYNKRSDASGVGQPALAAKYTVSAENGIAVFANLVLPFATGDYADAYKGLGIAPGVVYGKNYGAFQAVGLASYQINMKDGDDIEADNALRVFLKPGYMVNDKLAGYVGIDYNSAGDVSTTALVPGVTYTLSGEWAFEAALPYIVSESNSTKGWTVWASVYYTLGM